MAAPALTEREAAHHIGMSTAYLRKSRCEGTVAGRTPGPAYVKLGRAVRYRIEDLDRWLFVHRVDPGEAA